MNFFPCLGFDIVRYLTNTLGFTDTRRTPQHDGRETSERSIIFDEFYICPGEKNQSPYFADNKNITTEVICAICAAAGAMQILLLDYTSKRLKVT